MSSDTRSDNGDMNDDPTRPGDNKATVPPPPDLYDDEDGDEATVLARIPDELLAKSGKAEEPQAGLKQMFSREGGPPSAPRPPPPPAEEGDALLDMLFDDARDDRPSVAATPAPPPIPAPRPVAMPPAPPVRLPPPRPAPQQEDETVPGTTSADAVTADEETTPTEEKKAVRVATPPPPRAAAPDAETIDMDPADALALAGEAEAEAEPTPEPTPAATSSRAVPIPSRVPPPVAFEREQDANALLLQTQQRDAFVARAEWLKTEAEALEDAAARGRALLTVSELYAMAGEDATAKAIAEEAHKLHASPLAHRQVRGILAREGEWAGALEVLDAETRAAATPAARCHGAMLGAEIARLCLSDDEGAKKRVEQALRGVPADPRAHVQRLAEALAALDPDDGSPSPVSRMRLPDHAELGPLAEALHQIQAHRGLTPATAIGKHAPSQQPPGSVYEALLRVRASAAATDHAVTVGALEALAQAGPSLSGGAGWLAGVLAAARRETRPRAVEALRGVLGGTHGALARRALAARAIELDDAAAARSAMDAAGSDAFTAADRVAIAALTGRDGGDPQTPGAARDDIAPWLEALLGDSDLTPIAAAATAALGGGSPLSVGGPRARTAASLGRELASKNQAALRGAIAGFADASPEAPLARALSLELDVEDGAGGRVARALAAWRDDADLAAERAFASALVAEGAGEIERAKSELDLVRTADPRSEAAARAAAAHADAATAARLIAEHAQALEGGPRAAVLLTEAAVRLTEDGDAGEAEALLRRAAEVDRELPLPYHLGERAARARGEREALIEWIRTRREASDDVIEQAHDCVREALLLSEGDASAATPLLDAALRARPTDVALRDIYERLSPEPLADRAAWREARAAETSGVETARLALEAALEMERAGDLEGAARCAQKAVAAGESQLAPILAYRAALGGQSGGDIVDTLLPRARDEKTDPVERLEIYERLAELDERGRGDTASGLLWRRTILEENSGHLPTLRRIASILIGAGRDEELDPIALEIARALEGPESVAHAMVSARLRQQTQTWDDTYEAVALAFRHTPRSIWSLRQMAAHARARGEFSLAVECDRALGERTSRASEASTLSLRAAQAAHKANQIEDTLAFLAQTIDLVPNHLVAHLELAAVLEATNNAAGAAAALEAAANACSAPAERAKILYRAAQLWQDKAEDSGHARQALEAVAAIDPSFEDVFQRLRGIYIADGARAELAQLLELRLSAVTDPAERVEMEVLRGRALADVGDAAAAKGALKAALDANPDHVEALGAFADVCAAEQDWAGAEDAWIKLARLVPESERQVAIYLRLGELYDQHLPNPERAELAYQEILKRAPNDTSARERLVTLYQKMGDAARAIEQQTLLVNAAEAPEQKCVRTTELAQIYEATGDAKKAEATLLQARKTWPKDDVALAALARFYLRNNQVKEATVLLDRAVADARRALGTGRFEPYLFSTIAAVADLKNRPDAARVAKAAVASIDGGEAALEGAGARAGDESLDELLAPDVLTPAFRDLLRRTGPLLDTAVPFDLTAVRAAPLPPQLTDIGEQIRQIAAGYGLPNVQVFTSNVLASVCVPVSTHPPTLVLGHPLVTSAREDIRTFLVHRALKVLQGNASAIARTAPIDLWPLLAAYLKAFNNGWTPQGVDQGKLTDFYGRISRAMPKNLDPQVNVLAADVIGSIGNRAGTLNTVINGWGNRAGLLAVGDLNVAISGIAWAGGHTNQPPAAGKERVTWINRNAEARELVVFSVSDHYADARNKLGLSAEAPAEAEAEEAIEVID